MADSTRLGMFLIATVFTWVCFSVVILQLSQGGGITGSTVGLPDSGMTLDDSQHVFIKPRGAHANKILRTMDSVEVEDFFGDGFTAWVDTSALPTVKTLGDVYFLPE